MALSSPDYSNLMNATANRNNVRTSIAERKANETQLVAETALSLFKTVTTSFADAIQTQHKAQQAELQPEINMKMEEYNQLLENSIRNGTTRLATDESGRTVVQYAPEVLEYRETWLDDVTGREGVLGSTVEWADRQLEAYYNMSDEKARFTIAAQNANIVATQMDTDVKQATIKAAQMGDYSYVENFIAGLDVSDQYKQAYLLSAQQLYESEYNTLQANNIAATEGIDAAYKYINSLEVDSATKDTLKNGAYKAWQDSVNALKDRTTRTIDSMLEANKSWAEIRETVKDDDSYTAYERDLVDSMVTEKQTKVVTNMCAPFVAQVQSGDMTVDELEQMKETLEMNKGMFSGIEKTYETYSGIISQAIADRKKYDESLQKEDLSEFKNLAQNLYDQWNQGTISGDDALSQIRAICDANPDNLDVVNEMNNFVNKIIGDKVPLAYRGYVNMKLGKFDTVYNNYNKNTLGGYQPMTDAQVGNYEQLYKDTVNFIASREDLTLEEIDKFMEDEMSSFFARYADQQQQDATVASLASMVPTTQGQDVPSAFKTIYNEKTSTFKTSYLKMFEFTDEKAMDYTEYTTYEKAKGYYEGALKDYIISHPDASQTDIDRESDKIMETFRQPYATEDTTLVWGVNTAGTKAESFINTLQSFYDTEPFRYTYNTATDKMQFQWVNDKAQDNWENTASYGVEALQKAGYDVLTTEILQLNNSAIPTMVFVSSDGEEKYTINLDPPRNPNDPQIGDVMRLVIKDTPYGQVISEQDTTRVTPQASSANGTAPSTSANFTEQQTTMQKEEKDRKYQEAKEAVEANIAEQYGFNNKLTIEQEYAKNLRDIGVEPEDADKLAPKVLEEVRRLQNEGFKGNVWQTALDNVGIEELLESYGANDFVGEKSNKKTTKKTRNDRPNVW